MFKKKGKGVQPFHAAELYEGKEQAAEFNSRKAEMDAEMKVKAHEVLDTVESPYAIIAPTDYKDGKGIENNVMIAISGSPKQAFTLLAGFYAAKADFLEQMAKSLPEDVMDDLLKFDREMQDQYVTRA